MVPVWITTALWFLFFLQNSVVCQAPISKNNCTASWTESVSENLLIQWFGDLLANVTVTVTAINPPPMKCWSAMEETAEFSQGEILFHGKVKLCPNSNYRINILFDCGGSGNYSDEKTFWTDPDAPDNVEITNVTSSSIVTTWYPPYGDIDVYEVFLNGFGFESNETIYQFRNLDAYSLYQVEVSACHQYNCGPRSLPVTSMTLSAVPFPPRELRVLSIGTTSIEVKWQEPSPNTGPIKHYVVWWSDGSNSTERITENTTYIAEGLDPFTTYTLKVKAVSHAGAGNWSREVNAETKIGVPYAVTTVEIISVTNASIHLRWEEPKPSTGPILHYTVQWKDSGSFQENSTHLTNYKVRHLTPYTQYKMRVRANTAEGNGEWSAEKTARTDVGVPFFPRLIKIRHVTDTGFYIQWQAPDPLRGPILHYILYIWAGNDGREITENNTFHFFQDLNPYTTYSIKVRAVTSAGRGNWSEEQSVRTHVGIPYSPSEFNATSTTNHSITLSWKTPTRNRGPIISYSLEWGQIDGHTKPNLIQDIDDESYTIEGLDPYTWYAVRVRAETEAGLGEWTDNITLQTDIGIPLQPSGLDALSVTNESISLSWNEPSTNRGPIISYSLEWMPTDGRAEIIHVAEIADESYTVKDLDPYTWYLVRVRAVTEAGVGEWTENRTFRTDIGIPFPPKDVNAPSITNHSIGLSWNEPTPNRGPIISYSLEWGTEDGQTKMILVTDITDQSYTMAGLEPYTWYSVRVRAETMAGTGEWTERQTFQTDIGIPTRPVNLTLRGSNSTSISVAWEEPIQLNGPLLWYEVQWETDVQRFSGTCHATFYTLSDLHPYTQYSVKVAAWTVKNRGEWSDVVKVRTDIAVPSPALIQSILAEDSKTLLVTWLLQGVYPGPTQYDVQVFQRPGECSEFKWDILVQNQSGIADWVLGQHRRKVMGLTPGGRYYCRILLKTLAGSKISNDSDEVRMMPEVPDAPRKVTANCTISPTEAYISWKPPKNPNGDIVRYLIQYSTDNVQQSILLKVADACADQEVQLGGLLPERPYTISVSAFVQGIEEPGEHASPKGICLLPAGVPDLRNASHLQAKGTSQPNTLILEWCPDMFSDRMGALVEFAILVGTVEEIGNLTDHGRRTQEDVVPTWMAFFSGQSKFYQATPKNWNPFESHWKVNDPMECEMQLEQGIYKNLTILQCTIGSKEKCFDNNTYCNGPLKPDTEYGLKLRGFTRGGYADTQMLLARTGTYPKPKMGLVAALGLIAVLFVASMITAAFIIRRKGGIAPIREAFQRRFRQQSNLSQAIAQNQLPLQQCQTNRMITKNNFSDHVRLMMTDSHLKFSQEFEKLRSESPRLSSSMAEMEENRVKNRWANILPFDDSRVKLLPLSDEPGSDYINANYIPGDSSLREYIATQGPLPNTLDDFWRMVWEQGVTTIVMLTQCIERGKSKCETYWPEQYDGGAHYGDLLVRTESESVLASYVIRILRVQLGSRERQIRQLHFTRWPDFGCPESPGELINFVRVVREHLPRTQVGPILVHCSAGVGRTGTFIAVDRLSQRLQNSDCMDVYGTVLELRHYRPNMVQTEDQYIYIHLCVQHIVLGLDHPREGEYEDVIYSNIGMQDTAV